MTAASTVSPRYASASALSLPRIIALISGGLYCLPPASTRASPLGPATTLYGTIASSSRTSASLRPMKRLIEKTVFWGLVTAWRFATWQASSPSAGAHAPQRAVRAVGHAGVAGAPAVAQQVDVQLELLARRRGGEHLVVELVEPGAGPQQVQAHPDARDVRVDRH